MGQRPDGRIGRQRRFDRQRYLPERVSLVALSVSIWQVRWAQAESKRKQTLEHLHRVLQRVQNIREHDLHRSQADALAFFSGEVDHLTEAARSHLLLLDELDLLALAMPKDAVDGEIVREYLRSTIGPNVNDTIHFMNHVRRHFNDPELYQHAYEILPSILAAGPRWAASYTPDTPDPHNG